VVIYRILAPVDDQEGERLELAGQAFLDRKEADRVLIDIQGSTEDFSAGARKQWAKILRHPNIIKAAIFGGNTFVRTIATFVIGATGRKNIKFFATEKDAREWLYAPIESHP